MTGPYSMKDLARLSGIPARSIRGYIQRGILKSPRHAGPATSYDRETLGLVAVIRHIRREHGAVHSDVLKKRLRTLEADEVEAWAEELDPLETAEDEATTVANAPAPLPAAPAPAPPTQAPLEIGERWLRVPLVPGLELMMLEGSGELVSRLAREIQGRYRATGKAT